MNNKNCFLEIIVYFFHLPFTVSTGIGTNLVQLAAQSSGCFKTPVLYIWH